MRDIAVYTVIIGNYDRPKPVHKVYHTHADYYMFTDLNIVLPPYKIIKVVNTSGHARRESRKYKICPEEYLNSYKYSIYIDGSVELKTSPQKLIRKYLRGFDIAVFKNAWNNCVYKEFDIFTKYLKGRADPRQLKEQEAFYRREGFPENWGQTENCVVLRKNTETIRNFDKFWMTIYNRYSERDQIAFAYCAWKSKLRFNTLQGYTCDHKLPVTREFILHRHRKGH